MKRWIIAAIILAATGGCEQSTFPEQKVEAQSRWMLARAKILYRVAENRLRGGQVAPAEEAIRQALALQSDYHDARVLLARIEIETGRYGAALADLQQVAEDRPKSAQVAYLMGVAEEKRGRLPEALAHYRRAHAMDEKNLAAVKAAAEVLVATGEVRRAQLYVESYLPKAPEDPGMHELAGQIAMMRRDWARAAEHYRHARERDHKNLRYQEALGRALYAAGQHGHALDTLSELVQHKDYKPPTWLHMMLGDCYLALNQPYQAFDAYFTAGEQMPREPAVWVGMAKSALAMRDETRAILSARKALQLRPGQLDAVLLLGYGLLRDGQAGEAVKTLARAARAHPDNAVVHCVLGQAHAAAGNHAEAVRCFTVALRLDPANQVARELLDASANEKLSRAG
jgi:tetratricopeptide (TPR) repeat protein